MTNFAGLTFAAVPVITGAGALNTALVAGTTVIAGIVDPTSTQRIFNPQAEGNPVVSGTDSYTVWLPVLSTISAASVVDNLQSSAPTEIGQITLTLKPAAKNTIEASSVMNFKVSPQAIIITCTAGTF